MTEFQLRSCVWEITLACCFSCKYCGSRAGKNRENELTLDECKSVARQLWRLGCKRVSLIGGEVFLRRDWQEILQCLTDYGISTVVITNGYLFTEDILKRLTAAGVESVAVSLDGPETMHDKYRQKGSWKRATEAIQNLTGYGIPTSVITTINAENVCTLEELYQELLRYPLAAWQLQACSPMGNAALGGIPYRFSPMQVISFVEKYRETAPFPVGIADNIGYFTETEGYLRGSKSGNGYFRGCSAGISAIGIDSEGNVRGCESMYADEFIEGNVRQKPLREIWENPDGFAYNRKFTPSLLTGKCAECSQGIYCAGGCRSYNYFVHGRLYEAPVCARNQV